MVSFTRFFVHLFFGVSIVTLATIMPIHIYSRKGCNDQNRKLAQQLRECRQYGGEFSEKFLLGIIRSLVTPIEPGYYHNYLQALMNMTESVHSLPDKSRCSLYCEKRSVDMESCLLSKACHCPSDNYRKGIEIICRALLAIRQNGNDHYAGFETEHCDCVNLYLR